jgi:hypothetical protein
VATLETEQSRLSAAISVLARGAWGLPCPVGLSEPPDDKAKPGAGGPKAWAILGGTSPADNSEGGSFCSEGVNQPIELILRECPPKSKLSGVSDGDKNLLSSAQKLRTELGLKTSHGVWQEWPTRWLGETYRDDDEGDADALKYVTLRVRLLVVLEVTLS